LEIDAVEMLVCIEFVFVFLIEFPFKSSISIVALLPFDNFTVNWSLEGFGYIVNGTAFALASIPKLGSKFIRTIGEEEV
jgi:hypothetical protein